MINPALGIANNNRNNSHRMLILFIKNHPNKLDAICISSMGLAIRSRLIFVGFHSKSACT
jgi:hypothetical protein